MDPQAEKQDELRKHKLKDFHKKVKAVLNAADRDLLYGSLKKYQSSRRLEKLLHALKTILNTPAKLDLLKDIRSFIPPHQVTKYDEEVPYHNMAHQWRSRSMKGLKGRSQSLQRLSYSQPSSLHNTPNSSRRFASSTENIFQAREGPVVKVLTLYLGPGDTLGFSVRGGSEHGLGIFVSEVETDSAAERGGIMLGDQIIEVNTISFDGIASSSAVKVLTGSDRLKIMVRRVGKVPGFKSTKEKIAWYDVELRRLVRGDPNSHNTLRIPGQMGLAGHERKINLNKLSRDRPHLGFNIRGGGEFKLGIYVSRTDPGGLAEQNGLKAGDQLIEVNGISVANRTHNDVVSLIKAQKTLILTVRDMGKYPAFKEIYAEYKWVDVNTGLITKTRSYKKHALETSGHIQSIPLRTTNEDIFREQFSESHIDSIGDDHEAFDSDGLDDVLMYLDHSPEHNLHRRLPVQEETILHSDYIRQVPLSPNVKVRNGLTKSLDNLHAASTKDARLDRVVPVSPVSYTTRGRNMSMAVSMENLTGKHPRLYTPNMGKKSSTLWSSDNTDDEEDRIFFPRSKSAMENAMEFQSIHDIHIASTSHQQHNNNDPWINGHVEVNDHIDSILVPKRDSDVVMIERLNESEGEDDSKGSAKGSVRSNKSSRREKITPRASLAVQALQNEAKKNHPDLASEAQQREQNKQQRAEIVSSLRGNRDEVKKERDMSVDRGSKGSKSRSIRQFLFGSKSKEKQDSKKKFRKSRKPLSSINFDQDGGTTDRVTTSRDNSVIYKEIEETAEGILQQDETAAVIRHLKHYESGGVVSQLVGPLFAILDNSKKMTLCTHIRRLLYEMDQRVFDDAVNTQFDVLEKQQQSKQKSGSVRSRASIVNTSSKSVSNKPPSGSSTSNHQSLKENNVHLQQPTPKRTKRQAPLPPTSSRSSSMSIHDGGDITTWQQNSGQKQQNSSVKQQNLADEDINGQREQNSFVKKQNLSNDQTDSSLLTSESSFIMKESSVLNISSKSAESTKSSYSSVKSNHMEDSLDKSDFSGVSVTRNDSVVLKTLSLSTRNKDSVHDNSFDKIPAKSDFGDRNIVERKSPTATSVSSIPTAPQVTSVATPPAPPLPPPPPPMPTFAPSPRFRERRPSVESISSSKNNNNENTVEAKSYRKMLSKEIANHSKVIQRNNSHNSHSKNQIDANLKTKNQNWNKSSVKRQGIYIESNGFQNESKNNGFSDMANQKLEQYKQASRSGSRDSLNNLSESESGSVVSHKQSNPGSSGGAHSDSGNAGDAKNNLMAELQLHLDQVKNKLDSLGQEAEQSVQSSPGRCSTYTAVGSVRRRLTGTDRDLVQEEYMDSTDMFSGPSHVIYSSLGSPRSRTSTINSDDPVTEYIPSDSVLQATNALAFLDNLECSDTSHMMDLSSISRATSHAAEEVMTSRSEVSGTSEATSHFGSYDVNPDLSLSFPSTGQRLNGSGGERSTESTMSRRDPPVFIAPPPPNEPPPSDTEERFSPDSSMSGGSVVHSPAHKNNNHCDTTSLRSFSKSRHQQIQGPTSFQLQNGFHMHNIHSKMSTSPHSSTTSPDSSMNESMGESPRYQNGDESIQTPNLSVDNEMFPKPVHNNNNNKYTRSPDSSMDDRSFGSSDRSINHDQSPVHINNISSVKSPESTADNDSLFAFLTDESYIDKPTPKNKPDKKKQSWLFRNEAPISPPSIVIKPIDSSTIGSSSGKIKQEQVQSFFAHSDTNHHEGTREVYLDKKFKTMGLQSFTAYYATLSDQHQGLSISGGTDSKLQPEIRIKDVFPGGAAEAEGSLRAGLQIASIDGTSLVNVTHMRAVVTIKRSFDNKTQPYMKIKVSQE